MRIAILGKKRQKETIVNLTALAVYLEAASVELFVNDPEGYGQAVQAVAELAYLAGGLKGMNFVYEHGFERGKKGEK